MRRRLAIIALVVQAFIMPGLKAADELPYLGDWSNGRGETLKITKRTLQFADDKPVSYRDVTRGTDGSLFELQITTPGEVNAFSGKTLAVSIEGDSMTITGYRSHADYVQEKDPQEVVTWEKDSA
jgi:hypothetical protein